MAAAVNEVIEKMKMQEAPPDWTADKGAAEKEAAEKKECDTMFLCMGYVVQQIQKMVWDCEIDACQPPLNGNYKPAFQ